VFFSSHDGALLRHDMGTVYLEVFPRGKTGEYTIPDNVDVIRDKVFRYSQITKLIVGNNVSMIVRDAFYNCSALTTVTLNSGLKEIGAYAFYQCGKLAQITIPATVEEIGIFAFSSCTSLKKVAI
jgi:hypothetical protein